ncbi:MAG TPA: DUF502 domain-containing protein, partial [Verrucomicrobiae bacterium]|nr:DUF502 domain-containing protein [Verrucomicrobiae bacterium]
MEHKSLFARWRANFLAGLILVLPAVITFAVIKWLFGTVSSVTNLLLFFLPQRLTHEKNGEGEMYWYWSVVALLLAVVIITFIGRLARNYFGRKMIEWLDVWMLRIPLFNKIYAAIKQVNEAFTGKRNSFKTVVLVEFPRAGTYSVGFITGDQNAEVQQKTNEKVVSVFVPTTPNPTS